jgi:hypothetical protein
MPNLEERSELPNFTSKQTNLEYLSQQPSFLNAIPTIRRCRVGKVLATGTPCETGRLEK